VIAAQSDSERLVNIRHGGSLVVKAEIVGKSEQENAKGRCLNAAALLVFADCVSSD